MRQIIFFVLALSLLMAGCASLGQTDGSGEAAGGPGGDAGDTAHPPGGDGGAGLQHPGELAFLFFSDTQPDPENMDITGVSALIASAVELHGRPELVIFGGDTVDDGNDDAEWADFWGAVGLSLDGLTTAAVVGNHDSQAPLSEYFDYPAVASSAAESSAAPPPITAPSKSGGGFFYTFTAGPAFFLMLDSNIMGAANQPDIDWLRGELQSEAARDADWRIAVLHHPIWTVSDIPKDVQRAETMRFHFLPLLEEYGVDLILCGHQHAYSRTLPMRGGVASGDGRGIVQVMAATGGKASYASGDRDYIAASHTGPNYLFVAADQERLMVTAYDGEHREIDRFSIPNPKLAEADDGGWRIRITDTTGAELWSFTEAGLARLPPERSGALAHAYSTVNNWPSPRTYAAEGYRVESILLAAGLLDAAQTVTFRSDDGYLASLTREQLFCEQYYFPMAGESGDGALPVAPIIAYRWREGSADLGDIRDDKPTLFFGQRRPSEQTNPAFVVGVAEIIIDESPCGQWPMAGTFPLPGPIASGETVKLQHPSFGLVKLHYTLDGSDPTPLSPVYNPSTFQPELNVPIPITAPTTIKVLVTGYGKTNSETAAFEFWPAE